MSNDAGDTSSRLSDALDQIFEGGSAGATDHSTDQSTGNGNGDRTAGDAGVDEPTQPVPEVEPEVDPEVDSEPYELPQIVPATRDATPPAPPRLPDPATASPSPTVEPQLAPAVHAAPPLTAPPAAPLPAAAPSSSPPAAPTTGWADHISATGTHAGSQLRTPGRRPRVRRVTRVLRHIDPWSTFKIALLFSVVAYLVTLTSGVLLWRVADSTGTLANVERWFTQFGWETFELKGDEIFHNAWIIGLFGVVAATGGAVLLATLFNLVSDIVGGIRMTVLEEEVVERTISSTRRYVVRRPPGDVTNPGGIATPDWSVDDDAEPDAPTPAPAPAPAAAVPPPTADWSVDDD